MNDRRLSSAYEIKRAAVDETGMFEGMASWGDDKSCA
jgi:hypothetical protein